MLGRKALRIKISVFGDTSQNVASAKNTLSDILQYIGNYDDKVRELLESSFIFIREEGIDSFNVGMTNLSPSTIGTCMLNSHKLMLNDHQKNCLF